MSFKKLKERVWRANQDLVQAGLVTLTFGNASEADPQKGVAAIKPSGVSYDQLEPEGMVVLSIETGERCNISNSNSYTTQTKLQRSGTIYSISISHSVSLFRSSSAL